MYMYIVNVHVYIYIYLQYMFILKYYILNVILNALYLMFILCLHF